MFRALWIAAIVLLGTRTAQAAEVPDLDALQVEVERIGADAGEPILVAGTDAHASTTAKKVVERLQSSDFVFGEITAEAPDLADLMGATGFECAAAIATLLPTGWSVNPVGACDVTALLDNREGTGRKFMRYASASALIGVGVLGGIFGLGFTSLGLVGFIDGLGGGDYAAMSIGLGILSMAIGIPVTIASIALIAAGARLARGRKKGVSPTAWAAPDGGGLGISARW